MRLIDKAFEDLEKEIISIRERTREIGKATEETMIYSTLVSKPTTNHELTQILLSLLAINREYDKAISGYMQIARAEENKTPNDYALLRRVKAGAIMTEQSLSNFIEIILDFMGVEIKVEK